MSAVQNRLGIAIGVPVLSVLLLLFCSFVGTKCDGGLPFLVAAGWCVLILCSFAEMLFPLRRLQSSSLCVILSAGRGGLIGVASWFAMMFGVTLLMETGDKFQLYVLGFLPAPFGFGAVAGSLVGIVSRIDSPDRGKGA